MKSVSNEKSRCFLLQISVILVIVLASSVNCGNRSSSSPSLSTTPLPVLQLPLTIPSSTLPISSLSQSLSSFPAKSFVIPLRLKLPKNTNSTKSPLKLTTETTTFSSLLPVETKSNIFRWLPFNQLFHRRQGRQTSVQIAVTLTLAITAALSAIILALLIALLISIGSLGYAVKKCSFGFGKYLYKLFGSVDQHSHKFIHIIHLIIRILNEVSGRQNYQTDFLFHLIHIIREVGVERQNQRLLAHHEVNVNVNDHGPTQHHGPSHHQHDLSSYPGFSDSPRGFNDQQSSHHQFKHDSPPKGYDFPRNFGHSNREMDTPTSYSNKTNDYEYSSNQPNPGSYPNLQYQNPYYNSVDPSSRSDSMYDDQHPNHRYD